MPSFYWLSTSVLSLYLLWSSYTYLFSQATIDGVAELGFPDHFRIELAVLKCIAAFIIIIPQIPYEVKQWAYAGVAFFILTAIVAHTAHKDPFIITIINLVLLIVLAFSYFSLQQVS